LTLNRKEGQSIYVGNDVKVTIISISQLPSGEFDVRLGCDGPRHVSIDREEVRDRRIRNMDKLFNGND